MLEQIQAFIKSGASFSTEIIVIGLVFFAIERLRPAEKDTPFFKSDFRQELGFALINALIFLPIFTIFVALALNYIAEPLIPYQMFAGEIEALPIVLQMLLGAFILDFSTYWRHRFTHRYLWPVHSIHHSALSINWLTGMRLHPIEILVALFFDLFLLHVLGFGGAGMLFAMVFLRGYNHFTHANINLEYKAPLKYILASPKYHRWHHADEFAAHGKNYCSTFSCIDLAFGTFYHPEGLPKGYGIGDDQAHYPQALHGQLLYPFKKILSKKSKK